MMEDLRNKSIDAVLVSIPMCKNMIEENNGIYSILETIDSNMQLIKALGWDVWFGSTF